MKPAVCVVSLLVGLLVALTPMAWASPVDPGWTKGLYDDGDHDDVINFLTSNASGIPLLPVHHAIRVRVFAQVGPVSDWGWTASPALSLHPPRPPPLS
jgi:hypothetical protein